MKNIALHSLGCKVNSYETEVMQQKLQEKGYRIVPFDTVADVYIVNTCTVTNIADRKSRQMLHRAKQMNPGAVVVAVGCYVQTGLETVEGDVRIDLAIGNNRKKDIVEILEAYLENREKINAEGQKNNAAESPDRETDIKTEGKPDSPSDPFREKGGSKTLANTTVPEIGETYQYEEMQLYQTAEHTRAYIKIQDGCNQFCSYCAIPYARGRVRSRRAEDILKEIKGMVEAGYKEIVLTGIHISSYGIEFDAEQWHRGVSEPRWKGGRLEYGDDSRLVDLVERIQEVPGLRRIRLGSMEPRIITEETAKRLSAVSKLCPHFHLSLQSGCDTVLKRMNRHYTAGEYFRSMELLRNAFDTPAITTDVIVGFPGETEEEFQKTKAFLEKACFYEMHIFKYSKRARTLAAAMPGQVPESVKAARSSELLKMEKRQSKMFRARYIGRKAEILLEEKKETEGGLYWIGHTKDYVKVAVKAKEDGEAIRNTLMMTEVKGFLTEETLVAERCHEKKGGM